MSTGLYGSSSSSSSQAFAQVSTATTGSPVIGWLDLNTVVTSLNFFILALCIFNTLILLLDSYVRYFMMAKEGDLLKNIQDGEKSFGRSWDSWITYIPLIIIFGAYSYFNTLSPFNWILGLVFIVAALIKIFHEYGKTPIAKVISGEDHSIIGRFFKMIGIFAPGEKGKDGKPASSAGGSIITVGGGLLGEVVNQVGGLGREAVKQTVGINIESAPPPEKKK